MSTVKYLGVGMVIAVLSVLTFLTPAVDGCSCLPQHPQRHFCDSDYVVLVRIVRKSKNLINHKAAYKIEIKKSYKMTEAGQKALKNGRLLSPADDSMCGYNFAVGELYVIAGRGNTVFMCDYIKEYRKMTIVERRGFGGLYRRGCKCKVRTCFGAQCADTHQNSCSWSPFATCESDYSFCAPVSHSTPEGTISKCGWVQTVLYKACRANP